MELSEILSLGSVHSSLKVQSKKRLFQEISNAASVQFGFDKSATLNALLTRESLGPTGVGRGIAIPHARLAECETVCGMFFSLDMPVDFEAVDRRPVDLVFVLFAPEAAGAEHLKALAQVSRTLRSEQTCTKLRSTDDPQAVYSILCVDPASQAA